MRHRLQGYDMTKLNIGCGDRYAKGWVNVDFHPCGRSVARVNILRGLPYSAESFDAVYSSHVLEHFPRETSLRLLLEMRRVLKPGGIVRVVVPDLEETCREYLRILDQVEGSSRARKRYEWVILELLDQLTRTRPSGLMAPYMMQLVAKDDHDMIDYVQSRTQNTAIPTFQQERLGERLRRLTPSKVRTKLIYLYIGLIRRCLPRHLRESVSDGSMIGEKHRWMYDRYGLTLLLQEAGFLDIQFLSATESQIAGFTSDCLDTMADGRPYKNVSIL